MQPVLYLEKTHRLITLLSILVIVCSLPALSQEATALSDIFSNQGQALSSCREVDEQVQSFAKSLPTDSKSVINVLDGVMRKGVADWPQLDFYQSALLRGRCELALDQLGQVMPVGGNSPQEENCYGYWRIARDAIEGLHENTDAAPESYSQLKAGTLRSIEAAEQVCQLAPFNGSRPIPIAKPIPPMRSDIAVNCFNAETVVTSLCKDPRVIAFDKSLPRDAGALMKILDNMLATRLDNPYDSSPADTKLWDWKNQVAMDHFHAAVYPDASVGDLRERCFCFWAEASDSVRDYVRLNASKYDSESRLLQEKGQSLFAIELAAYKCQCLRLDDQFASASKGTARESVAPSHEALPPIQPALDPHNPANIPRIIDGEAGKHFPTPLDALKSWASAVWASSKRWNKELAGKLYKNWDGTWSYTPSFPGEENSSNPEKGDPFVQQHGNPLISYGIHTHGDYRLGLNDGTGRTRAATPLQRLSLNEFSIRDKLRSGMNLMRPPQFMLTPGGMLREFVPQPWWNISNSGAPTYDISGFTNKGTWVDFRNIKGL